MKKAGHIIRIGLVILVLGVVCNAVGNSLTLTSIEDNMLVESTTGSLSNGAGPSLVAGRTAQLSNYRRRGLLMFDIATSIPVGSTITSAALTLAMIQTSSAASNVELHRVQASWGEGTSNAGASPGNGAPSTTNDATWLHRFFNTTTWTTVGGDYSTTVTAVQSVNAVGNYIWASSQLVADVQSMLSTPASNFGWLLLGDESVSQTTKTFGTRENTTAANRPALTVTFTPPAAVKDWPHY